MATKNAQANISSSWVRNVQYLQFNKIWDEIQVVFIIKEICGMKEHQSFQFLTQQLEWN